MATGAGEPAPGPPTHPGLRRTCKQVLSLHNATFLLLNTCYVSTVRFFSVVTWLEPRTAKVAGREDVIDTCIPWSFDRGRQEKRHGTSRTTTRWHRPPQLRGPWTVGFLGHNLILFI